MSTTPALYRLLCWSGGRIVSVSAPMPRDTALRSFHEAVSSGRFAPYDSGRVAVISDEEYGKRQQLPTAA